MNMWEEAFGSKESSERIIWFGYGFSVVSLIASLYVIISYLIYRTIRQNYFFFLIVNICLIDVCFGVSSVPLLNLDTADSEISDDPVCTIFGVLRTFANLSSYLLNSLFAWAIYCSLTETNPDNVKSISYYHRRVAIIYIVSMIASSLPLITDSIGLGTLYCDLQASDELWDLFWQIADYIAPFTVSLSLIITLVALTIWKVRKVYREASIWKRLLRLLFFPAIFLLVNSGGLGSRVLNLFEETPVWLNVYHFLIRQLQGAIHGGVYGCIFLLDRPKTALDETKSSLDSRNSSEATITEGDKTSFRRRISDFY